MGETCCRPDFLARCLSDLASSSLSNGAATSFSTQSLTIGMNSAGSLAAFPCTGNAKEVKQGRLSFPSGESCRLPLDVETRQTCCLCARLLTVTCRFVEGKGASDSDVISNCLSYVAMYLVQQPAFAGTPTGCRRLSWITADGKPC